MKTKDLLNDEIASQQKYFVWYKRIPIIIAIITLAWFFSLGIVDAVEKIILHNVPGFLIWLIWMAIGIACATIEFFIAKVLLSQKILSVLYLQIIRERGCSEEMPDSVSEISTVDTPADILDETDDFEAKANKLKELYRIGEIDKEDYKKRLAILRERYNQNVAETSDVPATEQNEAADDLGTKLSKLKKLYESGSLTEEEYRNKLLEFLDI